MEKHWILNWRNWPPAVKKAAKIGGFVGAFITVCGYALNRWGASFPSQGSDDAAAMLIGIPSIIPLMPFGSVLDVVGVRIPAQIENTGLIWILYFVAAVFNAFLLGATFALIAYVRHGLRKKSQ